MCICAQLMGMVYDTALAIKERIYGNRIVLFAPLYIANYCVNNCKYCAFRAANKGLQVASLCLLLPSLLPSSSPIIRRDTLRVRKSEG
jgi:hypothetical protein